jgi:hypothetical protein
MSINTRMVGVDLVLGFLHHVPIGSATDILENVLAPIFKVKRVQLQIDKASYLTDKLKKILLNLKCMTLNPEATLHIYMVSFRDSISSCVFYRTQNIIKVCDTPTSGHVWIYFSFSHITS